ncbi:MAG: Polyphosphate kinase 2, partial [uncultured Corynebacteriales bacterium]
ERYGRRVRGRHQRAGAGPRRSPAGPRLPALPGRARRAGAAGRPGPGRERALHQEEGDGRRARGRPQAHRRPAGPPVRRAPAQRAHRPAGHGHRRQGRHDQGRLPGREPAGLPGVVVQGPHPRGARPRLPVALPPAGAPGRDDPHLQPVALRGRAGGPGEVPGARGRVAGPVRRDQQLRGAADRERGHPGQVLPAHLPRRAAPAAAVPAGHAGQAVEVLRQRPRRAGVLGRLPAGLRRGPDPVLHPARPLVRRPGQPEVVPQPRRRPHHRRHPGGDGPAVPGAGAGPGPGDGPGV